MAQTTCIDRSAHAGSKSLSAQVKTASAHTGGSDAGPPEHTSAAGSLRAQLDLALAKTSAKRATSRLHRFEGQDRGPALIARRAFREATSLLEAARDEVCR